MKGIIIPAVTQKLGIGSAELNKTAEMGLLCIKRSLWLKWKGHGYKVPRSSC